MLGEIWSAARLGNEKEHVERLSDGHGGERSWEGWRKIGLYREAGDADREASVLMEVDLFQEVGQLGLECLVRSQRGQGVR